MYLNHGNTKTCYRRLQNGRRQTSDMSNLPPPDVQIIIVPIFCGSVDVNVGVNGSDANLPTSLTACASGGAFRPCGAGAAQFVSAGALQGCDESFDGGRDGAVG